MTHQAFMMVVCPGACFMGLFLLYWQAEVMRPGRSPRSCVMLCRGRPLARDVPFSALYWSGLEPIRRAMLPSNARPSQAQIMTANFVAGTVGAAAWAAAVTTPLGCCQDSASGVAPILSPSFLTAAGTDCAVHAGSRDSDW